MSVSKRAHNMPGPARGKCACVTTCKGLRVARQLAAMLKEEEDAEFAKLAEEAKKHACPAAPKIQATKTDSLESDYEYYSDVSSGECYYKSYLSDG